MYMAPLQLMAVGCEYNELRKKTDGQTYITIYVEEAYVFAL